MNEHVKAVIYVDDDLMCDGHFLVLCCVVLECV